MRELTVSDEGHPYLPYITEENSIIMLPGCTIHILYIAHCILRM